MPLNAVYADMNMEWILTCTKSGSKCEVKEEEPSVKL